MLKRIAILPSIKKITAKISEKMAHIRTFARLKMKIILGAQNRGARFLEPIRPNVQKIWKIRGILP